MTNREARLHPISEWLMEFSVLWALFRLLDWFVENQPVALRVLASCYVISLTTGIFGLMLRGGERQ